MSLTRYGGPQANYHQSTSQLFDRNPYQVIKPIETLPKLLLDFKKLYDQTQVAENNLYDVILEVEGSRTMSSGRPSNPANRILAQKQLLIARSGYFENVVFGEEGVAEEDKFFIEDVDEDKVRVVFKQALCDDIDLLRDIVNYMYWGHWSPDSSKIVRTENTFTLASQLDLKELRNNASTVLSLNLGHQNVVRYLFLADKYEGKLLKQRCIDYIIANRMQVHDELKGCVNGDNSRDLQGVGEEKQAQIIKLIGEIYKKDVISRKQSTQH